MGIARSVSCPTGRSSPGTMLTRTPRSPTTRTSSQTDSSSDKPNNSSPSDNLNDNSSPSDSLNSLTISRNSKDSFPATTTSSPSRAEINPRSFNFYSYYFN